MKKQVLIFWTLLSSAICFAQNIKNLETLNGFKKFKYGLTITSFQKDGFKSNDLTCKGKPLVKCYDLDTRNDSYYKIGEIQFYSTGLKFLNDQLFSVDFWTMEDESTYNISRQMGIETEKHLLEELTALFGQPTEKLSENESSGYSKIYRWNYDKLQCNFSFSKRDFGNITYHYRVTFTNLLIQNKAGIKKYDE